MVVKEGPIMIKEMGLRKAVRGINIGGIIGEEAPITQKLDDQNLWKDLACESLAPPPLSDRHVDDSVQGRRPYPVLTRAL